MKTRLLSVFLSILLLTSFFTPAANAAPPDGIEEPELGMIPALLAGAAGVPKVCEFAYAGMLILVSGACVVKIGEHLGKRWDNPDVENWDTFAARVSTEFNKVLAKNWVTIHPRKEQR